MKIFSLFGEILLKDEAATKSLNDLDKRASSTSKSMGLSFGSIASTAAKVGTVIGASMGIKDMIEGATNAQKTMAQMDAVLASTGGVAGMTKDQLIDLAAAQSKVTTFSAGTTKAAENLLLTFTGISSKTFPDTIKAAQDMATAMGTDLNSSVMTLGKALNSPADGLAKLTKQGVTFTQEQKDQVKAMQEAGDIAGAQSIMLAELQKEFGGSAEAAGGTFAGQLKILKNSLSGVGTSIGSTVLPYMQSFVSTINENMPKVKQTITDVINIVVPKFQEWAGIIKDIVFEIFPSFSGSTDEAKNSLGDLANNGLNFVTEALKWIRDNMSLVKAGVIGLTSAIVLHKAAVVATNVANGVSKAFKIADVLLNGKEAASIKGHTAALLIHNGIVKAATIAQGALNFVMSMNPIALVIIAIVALIAAFVLLWNKCDAFRNFFINLGEGIKNVFFKIVDFIKENWKSLILFLNPMTALAGLLSLLYNINPQFREWVDNLVGTIKDGFNNALDYITALPGKAFEWGKDFIQGFIDGIKGMIGKVGNAAEGVANKIKSFLHFSVPDEGPLTEYEKWPVDFIEGFAHGITNSKGKITDAVRGIGTEVKTNIGRLSTNMNINTAVNANNQRLSSASGQTINVEISCKLPSGKEYYRETATELNEILQEILR